MLRLKGGVFIIFFISLFFAATAFGLTLLDSVDIGTPASEAGHSLLGWGPIEPDTHGGGWGDMGSGTAPNSTDQKCRVTWFPGGDTSEASVVLTTGLATQDTLRIHALDGLGGDSFEVYVGPVGGPLTLVYTYIDSEPKWDSPEVWQIHTIDLTGVAYASPLQVQIVATEPQWPYFDPYGQLGIDWIEILGTWELPTMYWKDYNGEQTPGGYMPDIDQKQDFNNDQMVDLHYCAPVAEANSLWWLDKAYELGVFDPATHTVYMYGDTNGDGVADVLDLVQDLAILMKTNINQPGTLVEDEQVGIDLFLDMHSLSNKLYEHTVYDPDFYYIEGEVERSQDVKLDLGFWHVEKILRPGWDDDGDQLIDEDPIDGVDNDGDQLIDEDPPTFGVIWKRVGGHAVTVAGVDSQNGLFAVSDPFFDAAEGGAPGVVRPGPHGLQHPPTVHNNEAFASHDIYSVVPSISPGGIWALQNYPVAWPQNFPPDFEYNNGPIPPPVVTENWGQELPPVEPCMTFTEIEAAVIVSPIICGNNVVDPGETCDPPGSTPQLPPGNQNQCRLSCTYCGDGIKNNGEQCDDGNAVDGDGCSSICQLEPDISVSPTSVDFGEVLLKSSSTKTVTISNDGGANLTIGTITIIGANVNQFSKPNDNCSGQTLTPSSSCVVNVKFSPTSTGAKSATLRIPSNDPNPGENPLDVPLSGNGLKVKVTAPNGGESLQSGTTFTITLEIARDVKAAKERLYYKCDGDSKWDLITIRDCNYYGVCLLTYPWEVPWVGTEKTGCKVKVELRDSSGTTIASDTTDGVFTIFSAAP